MKFLLKPICAFTVAGLLATPVLAASNDALEAKVDRLQQEVKVLKKQIKQNKPSKTTHTVIAHDSAPVIFSPTELIKEWAQQRNYLPFDLDVPGHAFVSTGPYVGVHIQFAGNDLIVNSPSVNTDVQLLNIRKSIMTQLASISSLNKEPHSHLLLSGLIESQVGYFRPHGHHYSSDIDLTAASLDATIFGPTDWLTGFVEFAYDGSSPINSVFTSTNHYRVSNSRVYINKAFVTIGDFNCSPIYGTFGQFYVPFGTYSSMMVSDPLTKLLTRTKARAIEMGFQQQAKNAFYGSAYIFRGDTYTGSVSRLNNGGLNVGYKFDEKIINGNVGGGLIANIADSAGMQLGTGFANAEQIDHRVHGFDAHASLGINEHIDLIGEFVTAINRFSPNDMSYNGGGAKPWALDAEAAYSFSVMDRPSSIGVAFNKSHQALAMGLPLTRTALVFNTSIFRNTLQSLEFRRDHEYPASKIASGPTGALVPPASGKFDNAVTAQFDFYF